MKWGYLKKISKPVQLIIPVIDKPIHFDSIRECARFIGVDHSRLRYAIQWVGEIKGMKIQEVQHG